MSNGGESRSPLTQDQKIAIDAIFQLGWSRGTWPLFGEIDRPLYQQRIDSQATIHSLTPAYIRRDSSGSFIDPSETLRLTVRGANEASGRETVIPLFLQVLKKLVSWEYSYQAENGQYEPIVSQSDIVSLFSNGRRPEVAKAFAEGIGLLIREEQNIYSSFSRSSHDQEWSIAISSRIRCFQDVESIDDYLEKIDINAQEPPAPVTTERADRVDASPTGSIPNPQDVFIVHGRDMEAKAAITEFLEALGLHAIIWDEPVGATGSAAPYTGHIVENAFQLAHAVIVLLTPDEIAHLHPDFHEARDPTSEREPSSQVRPNVFFEAGMAFATHPHRTVIVEIGETRPFSDFAGRNVIRITNNVDSLNSLAKRLEDSGCPVDRTNVDWQSLLRFTSLSAMNRSPSTSTAAGSPQSSLAAPKHTARLIV